MAAISIQQCAEQSAAERRERRKQKILENSEKRLSMLLGVDGEQRVAPSMDGMSIAATAAAESQDVPFSPPEANASQTSCKSPCSKSETLQLLNNTEEDEDRITYVTPKYVDYVDKTRFWIAILLGCLISIVSVFTSFGSVFLPTIILVTTYECAAFKSKKLLYPMHGYIVNAILALGLNEELVANIGLLLDALWEVMIDLLLVSTSFITVRILCAPLLTQ